MKKYLYFILFALIVGLLIYTFGENGLFASILALLGFSGKIVHQNLEDKKEEVNTLKNKVKELEKEYDNIKSKDINDQDVVDFWKDR